MAGIVLPLDFLTQVDGHLVYLRPLELVSVFAFAWTIYFAAGVVAGVVVWGCSSILKRIIPSLCPGFPLVTVLWLTQSLAIYAALRTGKIWLDAQGFDGIAGLWSALKWWLLFLVSGLCAIRIFRSKTLVTVWEDIAKVGTYAGLVVSFVGTCLLVGNRATPTHASGSTVRPDAPDILLITVDTLSAKHLSSHGYPRVTTPHLDQFANQATQFTRFYANSNSTTPAISSMLGGTRPWTHRANQVNARAALPLAAQGLIARLKEAGYTTRAVATNPYASPVHTQAHHWIDQLASGRLRESNLILRSLLSQTQVTMPASDLGLVKSACYILDRVLTSLGIWTSFDHFDPSLAFSEARQMLDNPQAAAPVFLWVHLMPPHNPYAAAPPFVGTFNSAHTNRSRFDTNPPQLFEASSDPHFPGIYLDRYDESTLQMDHHVGEFFRWLKESNRFDRSLIIVSSDHGESFSKGYGSHGGPLLHEELIHVPLLIKEPGQTSPRRVNVPSEQIDLLPTVLDLLNLPAATEIEGRSLKPALRDEALANTPVFSMALEQNSRFHPLHRGTVAMIEGPWKYVHYFGAISYPSMPRFADTLHDVTLDPNEETDLSSTQPEVAARMRAAIIEQLQKQR